MIVAVYLKYNVSILITDGGQETSEVSLVHSIVIGRLKPYKNYTFYVRVYNGKSGSDQSEKVTCKTHDEGIYYIIVLHLLQFLYDNVFGCYWY